MKIKKLTLSDIVPYHKQRFQMMEATAHTNDSGGSQLAVALSPT